MRLKLTVNGSTPTDVAVDADVGLPVAELVDLMAERHPAGSWSAPPGTRTMRVDGPGPGRVLAPDAEVGGSDLHSGEVVSFVGVEGNYLDAGDERTAAATVVVVEGPDAGRRFQLRAGANQVGRAPSSEVQLSDPMVSKHHARINVTDVVEVIDLGSANGLVVDDQVVPRVTLRPGERVVLGDSVLMVEHHRRVGGLTTGAGIPFNRSPYLDPRYEGVDDEAPEPPEPPQTQGFPYLAMIIPLVFGAVLFLVTRQAYTLLFLFMSPAMTAGFYFQSTYTTKKGYARSKATFRDALAAMAARVDAERAHEVEGRRREAPAAADVLAAADHRGPLLWARRPDRPGFLALRGGLADQPSRSELEVPKMDKVEAELRDEVLAVAEPRRHVPAVPVVLPLAELGVAGVCGPRAAAVAMARGLLVQVAGLHSPAEVVLCALCGSEAVGDWDWLKWLPHTSSDHSPVAGEQLAAGSAAARLVAALEDVVSDRRGAADGGDGDASGRQASVVVLVDDDTPVERSRLVDLAERGPSVGVQVLWVASGVERLPSSCRAFLAYDSATSAASVGFIDGGVHVVPVQAELIEASAAVLFGRRLAPMVDAGARVDEAGDLPTTVSFLGHLGLDLVEGPDAIVERWRLSNSLPVAASDAAPARRKRDNPLHAMVGMGAADPVQLDLRTHGPHALVGGTTGAGKSEFLQTWVMGLATNHSPARVTFLFVDYKGGAAFGECVHLPHSVGLVTDLTPHLVRRALRSLNAELRHREHILNRHKAKDVLEMEKRGEPETPPSLVIVVDEFAALATEVPEFVDGVVNVAQRGRSLGLHLILATQRPAGVIRDNLRANTNLRVALRMADESDSDDVVGTKQAATFDPSVPGRGIAKVGPGRLTAFQTAYVGGWTRNEAPPPSAVVTTLEFGSGVEWEAPPDTSPEVAVADEDLGPNDLHRLVAAARAASEAAAVPPPRRPWLPELAPVYDLSRTPVSRRDDELIYAIADDPDNQQQVPVAFRPDVDGNMLIVGTGGSGKSGTLRTLAVAAGLSLQGGPCHVYGLDFGARGLDLLSPLPHVGSIVSGDDDERVGRLMRTLRQAVDERAARYATVRAGTITEYRSLAGEPEEPRLLLLLDGFPAFKQAYEVGPLGRVYDQFQSIATDGRQVGVHIVMTADREAAVPSSLGSVIQRRLFLRLANDGDFAMAGLSEDAFGEDSPPGRGFLDGAEVQVIVLGGSANTARQAEAVARLARELGTASGRPPAPEVGRLATEIALEDLPTTVAGLPTLGVADETLEPFGVSLDLPFFVVGPPRSGRRETLASIARSLRRAGDDVHLVHIGVPDGVLRQAVDWDRANEDDDDIEALAEELVKRVAGGDPPARRVAVFLEDAPRLAGLDCDKALVDLMAALGPGPHVVVACGEAGASGSSYPLLKALRLNRSGLALVPDPYDGDSIFKTPFPKLNRLDFPPGRGLLVRDGKVAKVQVARAGEAPDAAPGDDGGDDIGPGATPSGATTVEEEAIGVEAF